MKGSQRKEVRGSFFEYTPLEPRARVEPCCSREVRFGKLVGGAGFKIERSRRCVVDKLVALGKRVELCFDEGVR